MLLDPNKTPQVRNFGWQQIQYLRATINYNDPGILTGLGFAKLPQYAFITSIAHHVETAFNAGTTNPVSIGTTAANANEILAATAMTATGYTADTAAAGLGIAATAAGDVTVYAKYAPTGGAASAGKVHVVIGYVLNNDL